MCFFKEDKCTFEIPGIESFHLKGVDFLSFISRIDLVAVLITLFLSFAILKLCSLKGRSSSIVATTKSTVAEEIYVWIRDQLAKGFLGTTEYLPLFATLFVIIAFFNATSIVPLVNFPINSIIGYPLTFAIIAMLFFIVDGFKHSGLKFIKVICLPPNIPKFLTPLIVPLEILSNLIVRPFTLTIRLFVNMVAGHLLLLTIEYSAFYFIKHLFPLSLFLFVVEMILICFEVFVSLLQAYIFTVLTASYLSAVRNE